MNAPGQTGFLLSGEHSAQAVGLISFACRYLAGPGLDGFTAWIDQETTTHAPGTVISRDVLRNKLETVHQVTGGW